MERFVGGGVFGVGTVQINGGLVNCTGRQNPEGLPIPRVQSISPLHTLTQSLLTLELL